MPTTIIAALRRDKFRALSIICLALMALCDGSYTAAGGALIVTAVLCVDAVQLHRITDTLRAIAEGDRFVVFPTNWLDSVPCRKIAMAGERMRRDLIEADAAMADQRRLLAEARIRRDGASFFTTRFHDSVAQAFSSFAQQGDVIFSAVDDLNKNNAGLLRDANRVSDVVAGSADDIQAVSQAAAQIAELVTSTADQIAASQAASHSTLADLGRARETIARLKDASHEISTIVDIIRSVATQTSLLALNATIEAARAGEKGLGFAVVASEVKTLATRSAQATETIRRQIEEIQSAVEKASDAIDAIMGRVSSLAATHEAFTTTLTKNTAAIENIGLEADKVAGQVAHAMPDLATGVGEIELASRSLLQNARRLMAGSERLVEGFQSYFDDLASGSIKVGILHSLSGTLTAAERPLHDLLIGLIDEANSKGGLLGRPLEAIIVNPRAQAMAYAEGAKKLIDDGAAVIFGGWTSQSRSEVAPVVERAQRPLFYASQYEGGETSPWIVCTGGTPQQQAWPAVDFMVAAGWKRFALIGHPSIYSRGTHSLIKAYASEVGAQVAADLVVGTDPNWTRVVGEIRQVERDGKLAILSTLSGDDSVQFFREMARRGMDARRVPTLSLSIGEAELPALEPRIMAGNLVAWTYLHGIEGEANEAFIGKWRAISNDRNAVANDALHATYVAFNLWTMAVEKAGSVGGTEVRRALQGLSFRAPSGFETAVTPNQHLSLPAFVGQIQADGRIKPIWASRTTRAPGARDHDRHETAA